MFLLLVVSAGCPSAVVRVDDGPQDSFEAGVARVRAQRCSLSAIGTCGSWQWVRESNGFVGTSSYYDPDSGMIVARQTFDDVSETRFEFGQVDCEPVVTELAPCDASG